METRTRIRFTSTLPGLGKRVEEVGFLLGLLAFVVLSFFIFYFGLPTLVESAAKINGSGIKLESLV